MARTVVLRHDLPDGSFHYDWLLERPDQPEGRLLAFRLGSRPDAHPPLSLQGERSFDHRRLYLDFEGPISGGRGRVARCARGRVHHLEEHPDRISGVIEFGHGRSRFSMWAEPGTDQWSVEISQVASPPV